MIWIDVDTAVVLLINSNPLVDDDDGITWKTTIAYNETNMSLWWNFTTPAGAVTVTQVTPTTAGVHDWATPTAGSAMYTLEIPASGGTINNNTEGYGFFTGKCDDVLLWRSQTYGFRAAIINDSLVEGTDKLQVDVTQLGGVTQSATDLKDFADAGYDPATNKVQGVVLTDTCTTNTDMVGTDNAALASVCTEARLAELDAANLPTDIAAIQTDVDNQGFKKGVAVTEFQFLMVDSSGDPATSLTVSGTISKDGGAFVAITPGTVVEIGNGMYEIDLSPTEMTADMLTLRFTATGAKDRLITLITNE